MGMALPVHMSRTVVMMTQAVIVAKRAKPVVKEHVAMVPVVMANAVRYSKVVVKKILYVVIFAVMTFVVLQAKVVVTVNVVLNVVRIVVVKRINIAAVASRSINYAVRLMKFVVGILAIPMIVIVIHLAGRMTQGIQQLAVKTMMASVPAVSR